MTATAHETAERLSAQAAEAHQKAEAAASRAREATQRAEQERAAAILAVRKRTLAEYPAADAALDEREGAAREAFAAAVVADDHPLGRFIEWCTASRERHLLATEAEAARSQLEPDTSAIPTTGTGERGYAASVQLVVEGELNRRTSAWQELRQAELDAAGR